MTEQKLQKLNEQDAEIIEQAFLAIGRNGGNTINSPLRKAWEALRELCQLMEAERL